MNAVLSAIRVSEFEEALTNLLASLGAGGITANEMTSLGAEIRLLLGQADLEQTRRVSIPVDLPVRRLPEEYSVNGEADQIGAGGFHDYDEMDEEDALADMIFQPHAIAGE